VAAFMNVAMSVDMIVERRVFQYGNPYGFQYSGQYWLGAIVALAENLVSS